MSSEIPENDPWRKYIDTIIEKVQFMILPIILNADIIN